MLSIRRTPAAIVCKMVMGMIQDAKPSQNQELPEPIKNLLNSAGVLDAVPWDGPATGAENPDSYFSTPDNRQDYDWDLDSVDSDDVFEGPDPPPNLQVSQHV